MQDGVLCMFSRNFNSKVGGTLNHMGTGNNLSFQHTDIEVEAGYLVYTDILNRLGICVLAIDRAETLSGQSCCLSICWIGSRSPQPSISLFLQHSYTITKQLGLKFRR